MSRGSRKFLLKDHFCISRCIPRKHARVKMALFVFRGAHLSGSASGGCSMLYCCQRKGILAVLIYYPSQKINAKRSTECKKKKKKGHEIKVRADLASKALGRLSDSKSGYYWNRIQVLIALWLSVARQKQYAGFVREEKQHFTSR